MSPSGFKINKQGIARMMRDIQREFDKHPISVPVQADAPELRDEASTVYNGPVINIHGDRAQIAWGNQEVHQHHEQNEVAPGFEAIALALVSTLERLAEAGLSDDDRSTVEEAANEVLEEVTKDHPDRRMVKRGVAAVKGILAPLALGVQSGMNDGARDWARAAVEQLTSALG